MTLKRFFGLPVGTPFICAESAQRALDGAEDWVPIYVKMNADTARRLREDGNIQTDESLYRPVHPDTQVIEVVLIETPPQNEYTLRDIRERGEEISILLRDK